MSLKEIVFHMIVFNLINSKYDSFKNECGPFTGLDDETIMPQKKDCFDSPKTNDLQCCYVEGEKDLSIRRSCILIENTSEKRIEVIEELSEIATKVKVDCNTPKEFESNCGTSTDPNSEKDCSNGYEGDKKCCFVKITSEQFTGKGCREFDSININTIGEAVVAAKTVGAELEVKCNSFLLRINIVILLLFSLFLC